MENNIFRDDELTYGEHNNKKTKSDIELLKEKYERGNYLVIFKQKKVKDWDFCYRPNALQWRNDFDYKLINKKHESILRAYLGGKEIEYNWDFMGVMKWVDDKNFIGQYDENGEYRIKETKSNCEDTTINNGVKEFEYIVSGEDNKVKNSNVSHYDLWNGFEVIDLIKNTLTKEEYIGALKFNILKYKLRSKGQDEADNIKIQDYTRELNSILEDK